MKEKKVQETIESAFRKKVRNDNKVRNAYLVVSSDKLNIHLNIAEGMTGEYQAATSQAIHLASVGKLFTATLTGMLHEAGKLSFNDAISRYLDDELIDRLHIYKGTDYSREITIRQLLMQTSGLNDVFYHLWKKIVADPSFRITPRKAVLWGKENLKSIAEPGRRLFYTDTNYYLLGLIIESISGKSFHEVMHEMIFEPLGMDNAYMFGFSEPKTRPQLPPAGLFIKDVDLTSVAGVHQIDYAGGSVTAPLDEYLIFMKALTSHRLVSSETLNLMVYDDIDMGFPTIGFRYGYSIWKPKQIPLLMPASTYCWGCVGATGAFMFYHPGTGAYIIGTFNDFSYRGKALQFMFRNIIRELLKLV
jgi:D-alanyl-D-alanine carboxypeptidase